ncbi:MAG: 16S rRNA (cytosine(1402)-N(4))-methyltransferase RsmH [Patescibacteria group bacterium]
MAHESVLLKEVIEGLSFQDGDIYLDATVGSGGHMEAVWKKMKERVTLCGIDADETSISIAREKLDLSGAKPKLSVLNFRNIDKAPEIFGISAPTKILFDLGWSRDQFDEGGRGFSFQKDEPLVMTFKDNPDEDDTTAYDVVNEWSEENLADVIFGYGEEKYARRIAKAIVKERALRPIKTSKVLAEIVKASVPVFYRFGRIHPATKTFQAIRIAVNDELKALEEGVRKGFGILDKEGLLAVISFHSLEDRIVKRFFKTLVSEEKAQLINKKPIIASEEELNINPRARSAKLRIIQKISE